MYWERVATGSYLWYPATSNGGPRELRSKKPSEYGPKTPVLVRITEPRRLIIRFSILGIVTSVIVILLLVVLFVFLGVL